MTPSNYRANYTQALTLAAGVPQTLDVPIDGARDWTIIVKNTGGSNALTALSVARIPLTLPGAATAVTTGIPLAAGATLDPIVGENAPVKSVRLVLTSTSGTTVSIEAGGA